MISNSDTDTRGNYQKLPEILGALLLLSTTSTPTPPPRRLFPSAFPPRVYFRTPTSPSAVRSRVPSPLCASPRVFPPPSFASPARALVWHGSGRLWYPRREACFRPRKVSAPPRRGSCLCRPHRHRVS